MITHLNKLLMSSDTPSKPSKLCPTCGTLVSEDATRCLVCGTDFADSEKSTKSDKSVQGSRMPQVTLSLPVVLGLIETLAPLVQPVTSRVAGQKIGTVPVTASKQNHS